MHRRIRSQSRKINVDSSNIKEHKESTIDIDTVVKELTDRFYTEVIGGKIYLRRVSKYRIKVKCQDIQDNVYIAIDLDELTAAFVANDEEALSGLREKLKGMVRNELKCYPQALSTEIVNEVVARASEKLIEKIKDYINLANSRRTPTETHQIESYENTGLQVSRQTNNAVSIISRVESYVEKVLQDRSYSFTCRGKTIELRLKRSSKRKYIIVKINGQKKARVKIRADKRTTVTRLINVLNSLEVTPCIAI